MNVYLIKYGEIKVIYLFNKNDLHECTVYQKGIW